MPVRLVITTYAKPGQGAELAQVMADRCRAVQQEPGCQQFEVFQSALDPDKLVTLELWADQAALDTHAQVNTMRPSNAA
jgi:quinol monooxygenase YgiN